MIKIENTEVMGWEAAIRGMRNPMNSWERSDSYITNCDSIPSCSECIYHRKDRCINKIYNNTFIIDAIPVIGPNDYELMMKLAKGGSVHAKYRRMITVYVDITAPLYW